MTLLVKVWILAKLCNSFCEQKMEKYSTVLLKKRTRLCMKTLWSATMAWAWQVKQPATVWQIKKLWLARKTKLKQLWLSTTQWPRRSSKMSKHVWRLWGVAEDGENSWGHSLQIQVISIEIDVLFLQSNQNVIYGFCTHTVILSVRTLKKWALYSFAFQYF